MVCRLAQLAAAKGGGRAVVKTKPDAILRKTWIREAGAAIYPPITLMALPKVPWIKPLFSNLAKRALEKRSFQCLV
jgi:hypothetical protein